VSDLQDGSLVRENSSRDAYLIYGKKKILIPSGDTYMLMGINPGNVQRVADGSLAVYPTIILQSATSTPPSLAYPPDNAGGKYYLNLPNTIALRSRGKDLRIVEVRGWLRYVAPVCNGADPDWWYYLEVDPQWADENGWDLNSILKVGNILVADFWTHWAEVYHTTLLSPYAMIATPCIKVELNGYREPFPNLPPKPKDWTLTHLGCPPDSEHPLNTYWPFHPHHPVSTDDPLYVGLRPPGKNPEGLIQSQYVSIAGSILLDSPHTGGAKLPVWFTKETGISISRAYDVVAASQIWGAGRPDTDINHPGRWTEIHPPDTIRVLPYKEQQEIVKGVAVVARNALIGGEARSLDADIFPPDPRPPYSKIKVTELVGPETNYRTITEGNSRKDGALISVYEDHVHIHVRVQGQPGWGAPGKFKAIYRVRWEPYDGQIRLYAPWIKYLYIDLLGRIPSEADIDGKLSNIAAGTSISGMADIFLFSQEFAHIVINNLYKQLLDRAGEPGGVSYWVNFLINPRLPGVPVSIAPYPIQEAIVGFCESTEYKSKHPVPNEFIRSLYVKILGREPELGAVQGNPIHTGKNTADVIRDFLRSEEYAVHRSTHFYRRLLQRESELEPSGHARAIQNGDPLQNVVRGFITSEEYRAKATSRQDNGTSTILYVAPSPSSIPTNLPPTSTTPPSSPTPNPRCQALERELASFQSQLASLQAELRTAPIGGKAAIVVAIREKKSEIAAKQTELQRCLQQG
jgi:hypothetical protein